MVQMLPNWVQTPVGTGIGDHDFRAGTSSFWGGWAGHCHLAAGGGSQQKAARRRNPSCGKDILIRERDLHPTLTISLSQGYSTLSMAVCEAYSLHGSRGEQDPYSLHVVEHGMYNRSENWKKEKPSQELQDFNGAAKTQKKRKPEVDEEDGVQEPTWRTSSFFQDFRWRTSNFFQDPMWRTSSLGGLCQDFLWGTSSLGYVENMDKVVVPDGHFAVSFPHRSEAQAEVGNTQPDEEIFEVDSIGITSCEPVPDVHLTVHNRCDAGCYASDAGAHTHAGETLSGSREKKQFDCTSGLNVEPLPKCLVAKSVALSALNVSAQSSLEKRLSDACLHPCAGQELVPRIFSCPGECPVKANPLPGKEQLVMSDVGNPVCQEDSVALLQSQVCLLK